VAETQRLARLHLKIDSTTQFALQAKYLDALQEAPVSKRRTGYRDSIFRDSTHDA
jgi:hypothetical protein